MENNTPDGTTKDSEKDLPAANPNQQYKGQEGESHSTAAEGTLKSPEELPNYGSDFEASEEHDIDDLIHKQAESDDDEPVQGGQTTTLNKEQKFTPDDISS